LAQSLISKRAARGGTIGFFIGYQTSIGDFQKRFYWLMVPFDFAQGTSWLSGVEANG
jgi:hypothetical protein